MRLLKVEDPIQFSFCLTLGLVIYFAYSRKRTVLSAAGGAGA